MERGTLVFHISSAHRVGSSCHVILEIPNTQPNRRLPRSVDLSSNNMFVCAVIEGNPASVNGTPTKEILCTLLMAALAIPGTLLQGVKQCLMLHSEVDRVLLCKGAHAY